MLRIPNVTKPNLRVGDYSLMRIFEDTIIINYNEPSQPPQIYCIRIKNILDEGQSVEELLNASNLEVNLLEGLDLASPGDEFGNFYNEQVRGVR